MTSYKKPLPNLTPETKPFWKYCQQHELRMQKCAECGYFRYPPSIICPRCHAMEAEWVRLSGEGKVYSFVIFHYIYNDTFADDVPYVVATIELKEGPRIMGNIIGIKPEDVKFDMPVEVQFEDVTDEFTLYKFQPGVRV